MRKSPRASLDFATVGKKRRTMQFLAGGYIYVWGESERGTAHETAPPISRAHSLTAFYMFGSLTKYSFCMMPLRLKCLRISAEATNKTPLFCIIGGIEVGTDFSQKLRCFSLRSLLFTRCLCVGKMYLSGMAARPKTEILHHVASEFLLKIMCF